MKPAAFEYRRAASAAEAVAWLAAGGDAVKPCAGTQSLGPMLNLRVAETERLVDVSRIAALQGFELLGGTLRIGSAVTHARIEDGLLPDVTRGLLPAVAANIAYRAVRNRGTLGGSLAHADPAADWVSVMSLLNATLVVLGPGGERRAPAGGFFLGPLTTTLAPDELLVAVEVPRFSDAARWAYRKMCRKPGEFATAIAALWRDPAHDAARVLLAGASRMPHVVADAALLDALQRPATAEAALAQLLDGAGLHDDFEREVQAEMLRRALTDLQRPEPA